MVASYYDQLGSSAVKKGKKKKEKNRGLGYDLEAFDIAPSYAQVAGWSTQEISDAVTRELQNEEPVKVTQSRIRVQLSRPLTWAEKEEAETNNEDLHFRRINASGLDYKFRVAADMEHIWVDASFGSRLSYDLVAALVEQKFVNVFPRAVRTFREYDGE